MHYFFALFIVLGLSNVIAGLDKNEAVKMQYLPLFSYLDADHDGVISKNEIESRYPIYVNGRGEFSDLTYECDHNKDDVVTLQEHVDCSRMIFNVSFIPKFDLDGDGKLSGQEIVAIQFIAIKYYFRCSAEQIAWVFMIHDLNNDSMLDLEEILLIDGALIFLDVMKMQFE